MLKTGGLSVYHNAREAGQGVFLNETVPLEGGTGNFHTNSKVCLMQQPVLPVFAGLFTKRKAGREPDGRRLKIDIAHDIEFRFPVE